MRPSLRSASLVVAYACFVPIAAAQPSFRALPPLPGYLGSHGYGISADGRFAVGDSYKLSPEPVYTAARWAAGGDAQSLGDLPGGPDTSYAHAVSAHGYHIVGDSRSSNGHEAFRWQGGTMTGLGDFPEAEFESYGRGISADGSAIVGRGYNGNIVAFRKVGGGPLVSLGLLPGDSSSYANGVSADGTVVIGYSRSPQITQAFRWTPAGGMVGLGDLPGGSSHSAAYGVSADGLVVVGNSSSASGNEAFRWTKAGGMVGLGDLPGDSFGSGALAVSADGSVVVGGGYTAAGDTAFIWDSQHGMRDLRQVLIDLGVPGLTAWQLQNAAGVSADGNTIVGIGTNPDGVEQGWIATLAPARTTATERPSVAFDEQQGNAGSSFGDVTDDGNQITFASSATNLVGGDTNAKVDVFVRNRSAGWTSRVSVSTAGAQGNNTSTNPAMSADGRYVVFESDATNLVAGDTNAVRDIFIRDRQLSTTTRVSVSSNTAQANGPCYKPRISADGRYVVFESDATNLTGGDTNGVRDVFLRDRTLNQTSRPSLTAAGTESNGASSDATVSDDGAIVCFTSQATNLVAGDTNGATDVFLRNRPTGATARVSVGNGGIQGNNDSFAGRVSGNGRYFAFTTEASNLAAGDTNNTDDIFLRDRFNATTTRITMSPGQANGGSEAVAICRDGRYIVYNSNADNLVAGDTNNAFDVYIHDNWTFLTRRASLGNNGQQPPGACFGSAVSADGRFVVFYSNSTNLVAGDTNGKTDVFLRDLLKP